MQTFDRTLIDILLDDIHGSLAWSRAMRTRHHRKRTPDRIKDLEGAQAALRRSARELRPLRHSLSWQPVGRAEDIRMLSSQLRAERRLIARMLRRS